MIYFLSVIAARYTQIHRGNLHGSEKYAPCYGTFRLFGAGKITILGHILNNRQDKKAAVIVNDMSKINIDSAILKTLNTDARIIPIKQGHVDLNKVLNTGLFNFAKAQQASGWLPGRSLRVNGVRQEVLLVMVSQDCSGRQYPKKTGLAMKNILKRFKKYGGSLLVTCARSIAVLMFAWINKDTLYHTLSSGSMTYWSRSRKQLWLKEETSGHIQILVSTAFGCDGDVILCLE